MTDVIGQGADAAPEDLSVIVPEAGRLEIDGIPCTVNRLKSREMIALLGILTRGFGSGLKDIKVDLTSDEAAAQQFGAMLLVALPLAVDEFIVFVQTVVAPVEKSRAGDLKKALHNPDVEVLLDVAERIVSQEMDDLRGLVGKAQAMWSRLSVTFASKRPAG